MFNRALYWTFYYSDQLKMVHYTTTGFTGSVTTLLQSAGTNPTGLVYDTGSMSTTCVNFVQVKTSVTILDA